jgi:hypothetical protein
MEQKLKHTLLSTALSSQDAMPDGNRLDRDASPTSRTMGTTMRAFVKRFLMHYGIYRRYPLRRLTAFRNAWRNARA